MSTIKVSTQYTGDNIDELVNFLQSFNKNDPIKIQESNGNEKNYKVLFKSDKTILLNCVDTGSKINCPFRQLIENSELRDELFNEYSLPITVTKLDNISEVSSEMDQDDLFTYMSDSDDEDLYLDNDPENLEFTIITNNIEVESYEKKEALSKWEQKLSENENRQAIIDALDDIYETKKDPYSVYNEADILFKLQQTVSKNVTDDNIPLLQKIIENKYNETNILPIVSDLKILNNIPEIEDREDSILKFQEVDLINQELDVDEDDKNYGELHILVEMIKQYSKKKIKFRDFLENDIMEGK